MLLLSHRPAKHVIFPPVTLSVIYHPMSHKAASPSFFPIQLWATALPAICAAGESLSASLSKKSVFLVSSRAVSLGTVWDSRVHSLAFSITRT